MAEPTLPEQVTKLYDLISGYHATHLLEIGRELGVWEAITARPGITSDALATQLGTDPFYTDVLVRTAFAFALVERDGPGWRLAPHFDQILGTPSAPFYLGGAARTHQVVGEDYASYVQRFREGSSVPYQQHSTAFMEAVAAVSRALKPGGQFVIFDETYPTTDAELRTMPTRFAALAQWFELTWGNRLNTKPELASLCASAGLALVDETSFSRFYIGVAEKR